MMNEVWMANVTDKSVQVVESNIRFTKLVFPVQDNFSWNGNAHNTLGKIDYRYNGIDASEKINGNSLSKVLNVDQRNDITLISYMYHVEKYAKGVGLVYKEIKELYSNNVIAGVSIEKRIEKGFIFKQVLVNYGYE